LLQIRLVGSRRFGLSCADLRTSPRHPEPPAPCPTRLYASRNFSHFSVSRIVLHMCSYSLVDCKTMGVRRLESPFGCPYSELGVLDHIFLAVSPEGNPEVVEIPAEWSCSFSLPWSSRRYRLSGPEVEAASACKDAS